MSARAILVGLALALAAGCVHLPETLPGPTPGEPLLSERALKVWKSVEGEGRRAELLELVDLAELVYRQRYGRPPIPVSALVFYPGATLPAGLAPEAEGRGGGGLTGLCASDSPGSPSVIHLATGGKFPGEAIFHELRHADLVAAGGDGDPRHRELEWRAVDRLGRLLWRRLEELR